MRLAGLRQPVEQVAELLALRAQVADVLRRRLGLERDPFRDRQAVPLEPCALRRIVREQAHRTHTYVVQDLCTDAVLSLIGEKAELQVRLDRVLPLILELVRAELVR